LLFPQSQGGSKPTVSPHLCAACGNAPKIPFVAQPCGHRYCYYCLRCVTHEKAALRLKCVPPAWGTDVACGAVQSSVHE
jgi:hypothetical protein